MGDFMMVFMLLILLVPAIPSNEYIGSLNSGYF